MTDSGSSIDLKRLKSEHPIQDVVGHYVDLREHGTYYSGRCPFHDDHDPSFAVFPGQGGGSFKCFAGSCGRHGDVIDFIGYQRFGPTWSSRNREQFLAVLEELTGGQWPAPQVPLPKLRARRPVPLTPRVQLVLHTAASLYHTTLLARRGPSSPYAYLRDERRFSDATIRCEGLGYAEGALLWPALTRAGISRAEGQAVGLFGVRGESLAGRIIFLERDRTGRVLHMMGRVFAGWLRESDAPKYLSLGEMDKPLYGWAQLNRHPANRQPVLLVESQPDRVTARQWRYDALANGGTQMKLDTVALLIAELRRPLIVIPHNDESGAGWKAAEAWRAALAGGPPVTIVPLPDEVKDLNELAALANGETLFAQRLHQFGFDRQEAPPRPTSRRRVKTQAELLLASQIWNL
jgi:DNA primase